MKINYLIYLSIYLFFSFSTAEAIIIDDFDGASEISASRGEKNFLTEQLNPTDNRLPALGSSRKLIVEGGEGPLVSQTRLAIADGYLLHSQDAASTGISKIIWDADQMNSPDNMYGLNNINLEADGSNEFQLKVLSFDSPRNLPLNLEIKIHHTKDNYSSLVKFLETATQENTIIAFPFNQFINSQQGSIDLSNILALELIIHGDNPDIDLILDSLQTDSCEYLPKINNSVIDSCGICNGNNSSCRDCRGLINGLATIDLCGVCGGDNSSCVDCRGQVNGQAKLDRCGICNGDGNSCLNCSKKDQTEHIAKLDNGLKLQEEHILKITNLILENITNKDILKKAKSLRSESAELQLTGWNLIWGLPVVATTCSNQQFCTTNSMEPAINRYLEISTELKKISKSLIRKLQQSDISNNKIIQLKDRSQALYKNNLLESNKIIKLESHCS